MSSSALCRLLAVLLLTALLTSNVFASEDLIITPPLEDEQTIKLRREVDSLNARIKELGQQPVITAEILRHKKIHRLREIAADVRLQRQATGDFQGFVSWMSANLAGYNRYILAGSYAAVVARILPIPYAGQASIFTKFVAQFTMALNNASFAINTYLNSSHKFIAMVDTINPDKTVDPKAVIEASNYADQQLLKSMSDAQQKLTAVADLSSGALSFLDALDHYMSSSDEYWNKAKGLFRKDVDPKEKSFVSESSSNLKSQAAKFNGKLKTFEELGHKQTMRIKSLTVYDELLVETAAIKL
ncbi:MAG: hypothetical protein A2X82_17615 [Geobacteraceae bacterium GWC2_55_20]|nr:MAG: hypothetical protein A2X82_17615 [Geobacteraceae bacterium GWC2_55_20]OGU19448.1 MAG: hypothetical protein A2X85_00285 [Geobacteraceae bacterium GWF2_54_21]HBA72048.1 hypothetical protein [Geobacter sp.]HCE68261.1 hypothetical protein [Geobacter sp.]